MNHRSMQSALAVAVTALLLCFLLPHGNAVAQKPMEVQPPPAPSSASPAAIPLAEVTVQSRGVSNLLRSLNTELLAYNPEIKRIQEQLIKVREQGNRDFAATATILEGTPTLKILQSVQEIWQQVQGQMSQRLTLLTARATHLQKALDQLANLQETWARTLDAAEAANAPGPILQEIRATIADLEAARPALQAQHARVLDLQSAVAQEVARCETMLARFAQAQQEAVAGILTQDGPPIWSPRLWDTSLAALGAKVGGTADFYREVFGRHIRRAPSGMVLQIALFGVLAVLFGAARRQIARWSAGGEGRSPYTTVFDHPYAAALLVPLALGSGPLWPVPAMVRQLSGILALFPMVRLTRQVADSKLIPWLYALGILFVVDTLRQALSGAPPLEQAVLLSEAFAGMVLLGWSLVYGDLRRPCTQVISGAARLRALRTGGFLVLIILAGGLAAGVFGYLRLARLLVSGLLVVGVLAVELYSVLRVVSGLLAFALHVWPLRRLHMVQHHGEVLAHRGHRVLTLVAVVTWVSRSLDYVGLLEPARSLAHTILFTKLQSGSLSISLGDVLAFVLVLWASYLFSALIRFVLREDIYPRTRIGSGLSYAVSSLLHYLILVVGFVMGLAALGVDLNKVTVLAGAFGVGIGFGLQSVVNNFVSGLILLFERPIHVGDTIEVGSLLGDVRHIGIRASKVRTKQGADIIVPNAQMVTERLTNWTLGDRMRRIELPMGVNYGAAPQKVIELMETVALTHPRVLRLPPPRALFTGFGDSSINFELRAWTDEFDDWSQIRSDLAVALYDAVQEAGMQFPFPQREVRMLHDTEGSGTKIPSLATGSPAMTDECRQGAIEKETGKS